MNRTLLLFSLLLSVFSAQLHAQSDSLHAHMVGHLAYPYYLNDVMSYVDTAGNEYALVGTTDGVSIVSLANPSAPTELFFLPGAASTWRDFAIWQHYAYVSTEAQAGLRIIDLGNLPASVQYRDTIIGGYMTAHTVVTDDRGYAYLNGVDTLGGGILILNLNNDPWRPEAVGGYDAAYVHDSYVRDDTIYSAEISAGRFGFIDVANPAQPQLVATGVTQGIYTHTTWLDDTGDILFTADEVHGAAYEAWDIRDIQNPVRLDNYRSSRNGATESPHNQYYHNGFLICSYYADGITIVDASHPHSLLEVGYYDPSVGSGLGFAGTWAADPFLPSGLILLSDMITGLWVVQADYLPAGFVEGNVTDAQSGMPISGALTEVVGTTESFYSLGDGFFSLGIADTTLVQIRASSFGYQDADTSFLSIPGQTVSWNPQLIPLPTTPILIQCRDAISGAAVPFASVELASGTYHRQGQADANGNLNLSAVTIATYDLRSWRWGHQMGYTSITVDSTHTIHTITQEPGYADDFSRDLGWSYNGVPGEGMWERAEPRSTFNSYSGAFLAPEYDVNTDFSDKACVTGNGSSVISGDDVDSPTWLTSPVMDLTGWVAPRLYFSSWFVSLNESNGASGFGDSLLLMLDDGSQTQRVWFRRNVISAYWRFDSVDLAGIMPLGSNMRIHLIAIDATPATIVEAAFDDMLLVDMAATHATSALQMPMLKAWPNPGVGPLGIEWKFTAGSDHGLLEVLDINGHVLQAHRLEGPTGELTIDLDVPAGIYLLRLTTEGGLGATRRIIRL